MSRPRRYLPPIAGGAQKTGWEALDKWVGGSGSGAAPASEGSAPAGGGKTGWEALEKWVGSGSGSSSAAAPAAEASAPSGKTGWEALDKWVGDGSTPSAETSAANGGAGEQPVAAGASTATEGGGGLMGFLKRLFGGK
jgi:hypothetical protein